MRPNGDQPLMTAQTPFERFSVCDVSLESDHANSVGAAGHDEVNGNTLDLGAVSSAAGPERVNRAVIWHSAKAFLA